MTIDAESWAQGLVGRTLAGRYALSRVLGTGGLGAVLEGRHVAVGKRVAVKVLLPEVQRNERIVERFQREARAAAACAREGVVDVLDFDRDPASGPFLVMEHIDGETLATRLNREAPLPIPAATAIGESILATLEAVHAAGIVHRDLKPTNVMFARTAEGREVVKVVDFGVARDLDARAGPALTSPGAVLGTPGYMAPEQAAGQGDVDARADLYALGAILYGCLAGRSPFGHLRGGDALRAVLTSSPEPLERIRPDLPPALVAVVTRAMQRSRLDRYPDARTMRMALAQATDTTFRSHAAPASAEVGPPTHRIAAVSGRVGAPPLAVQPTMQVTLDATQAATGHGLPPAKPARVGLWLGLALAAAALPLLVLGGFQVYHHFEEEASAEAVDTSQWQVIAHRRVTFKAPRDWNVIASANPEVDKAWGPVLKKKGIPPHVAISINPEGMTTLAFYVEMFRRRNEEAGGRNLLQGEVEAGVAAVKLEVTWPDASPPHRETTVLTKIEATGYIVRCFTAADDEAGLHVCRNVARSVRLAPAAPAQTSASPPPAGAPKR